MPVAVQVGERVGQLPAPVDGLVDRDRASVAPQPPAQVVAVDVLEHEVGLGAVLAGVDGPLDARVVEPRAISASRR